MQKSSVRCAVTTLLLQHSALFKHSEIKIICEQKRVSGSVSPVRLLHLSVRASGLNFGFPTCLCFLVDSPLPVFLLVLSLASVFSQQLPECVVRSGPHQQSSANCDKKNSAATEQSITDVLESCKLSGSSNLNYFNTSLRHHLVAVRIWQTITTCL